MAVTRLSDSQKTELVARFRAGEGSQALATAYGCSAATITRTVRAVLEPAEYERLKQSGGRRGVSARSSVQQDLELDPAPLASAPEPEAPAAAAPDPNDLESDSDLSADAPGVLAIEDADDFGEDEDDEDEDDDDEDDEDDLDEDDGAEDDADDDSSGSDGDQTSGLKRRSRSSRQRAASALAALGVAGDGATQPVQTLPLEEGSLPLSAYMLVDKTVELQARPLSEFPELGLQEAHDLERQALVVYGNPRQAKRQCGRSQRVIKIPDTSVFVRTSRFLVSQGISRVVIEGALYSLPGS
ncbi:MAG: helix-turn-helix domain-containing protein [Cyanobium sp.]